MDVFIFSGCKWRERIISGETLMSRLIENATAALWRTPLRRFGMYYRYVYNFTPEQLGFFVECLSKTRAVPGDILEIGCANGATACFLNRHMQVTGIDKNYFCVDTFSGFTESDIRFESEKRGKQRSMFKGFRRNSIERVEYMLKQNGCSNAFCIETDVKDYVVQNPVSFCLLDVDLYLPTRDALKKVWSQLSPGGMIVVDDCVPNNMFDGALQAYEEFRHAIGAKADFRLSKLGVITSPAQRQPESNKLP